MEEVCRDEQIPFELCGKVIVATRPDELPALGEIFQRGLANGVACRRISAAELRELEPHCAGIEAIHVPEAGIVDYRMVARRLAEHIVRLGGVIQCGTRLTGVRTEAEGYLLQTTQGERGARVLVTCAGLQADRVAEMCGKRPESRIVPFRGEYFELKPQAAHLCRNLIYPVPDPRFPFLGVHFTRMIQGGVECGPNAVLALAREGYRKTDFNPCDVWDAVSFVGFRRLSLKYLGTGLEELWRSCSKGAFVAALQRLMPEITCNDLVPAPAGVRAQAVTPQGTLVDDFLIESSRRMVHVLNAPSPAATASLQIGKTIVERIVPLLAENGLLRAETSGL